MERIRGGWANVPPNLKTKTMLAKEGKKPTGEPKAEVWTSYQWAKLYDANETTEKKPVTVKQLAALEKARAAAEANRTCSECEEIVSAKDIVKQEDGSRICKFCLEWIRLEKRKTDMIVEGERVFRSWFYEDFVILDTETTDLNGEIIEIGIMDRSGQTVFHSLIKPILPVVDDSEATAIHGITDDHLEDAPRWSDVWDQVLSVLNNKLILSYNADFDKTMVANSCRRNGIKPIELKWGCVMEAYRLAAGSEKWISLADASGIYTAHRAREDCRSTLQVIRAKWAQLGLSEETRAVY
ncbi:3'-5' exonuclease [Paenibacillus oralis]|uniref:3'-5' exonuclease n=1 Tax=Paenibacillus oralis TaxID=2490856 RepID=A0A3P3T9Y5_9BACL|nr:3'-5' exonuclease [Paenibacillus oralis]RRJ54851.1 3'-5' exonuclease [Paenibacillus oralis]